MTLQVEDGTAKTNAESYASTADADTYLGARGFADWVALTDVAKEANLRKGTDYLTEMYRERWKGWRFAISQSLDWPRQGVQITDTYQGAIGYYQLPMNVVPPEVKKACIELAYKAMSGDPLMPDILPQPARETVGPVSVEWFTARMPKDNRQEYPAIDKMLSQLLEDGAANLRLARA